jgi:hypothetical protein
MPRERGTLLKRKPTKHTRITDFATLDLFDF